MPPEVHEVLRAVGRLGRDMGQEAYLVGGMVRDLAIGRPNIDLDVTVVGDAQALAGAFARATGSSVKGRTKFGTCKVESRAFGSIDMATARSESYRHPGALPDVAASGLEADLARRDFSLNAMAIALAPGRYGRLLDPFGGVADLSGGSLRILHPASFRDDPTRMLRGVRFAARLGFAFEDKTLGWLRRCIKADCIGPVSGKRILTELMLICKEGEALTALRLLRRYGILGGIDPALGRGTGGLRHLGRLASAMEQVDIAAGEVLVERPVAWMAGLFLGLRRKEAEPAACRLTLPRKTRDACLWVAADLRKTLSRLSRLDAAHPYGVVNLLRHLEPEKVANLFAAGGRQERSLVTAYLETWRRVSPYLDGRRVVALGIPKGPRVGRMLERLLQLRLQGELASAEDEIAYVGRRVRSSK